MPPTLDSDQPVATDGRGKKFRCSGNARNSNGAISKLGVVQQGALADLLLVDGDPIANLKLMDDPAKYLRVIVKDGKIFTNLLR